MKILKQLETSASYVTLVLSASPLLMSMEPRGKLNATFEGFCSKGSGTNNV